MLASFASFRAPPDSAGNATAGLTALWAHLAERSAFVAVALGIVFVAWLVNRFAPSKRRRIRRTLIPFLIYLVLWGISATFAAGHAQDWADRIHAGADLFLLYTVINLAGLAVFDLLLPALRLEAAEIAADLTVGLGYVVGTFAILRSSGMDLTSVLAGSAGLGVILSISLQATLGNILGGVALQLDNSIHAGDWIQLADGTQGKVKAVHWRHTVVETRNWDTVLVPNSSLLASNILILGKRAGAPVQHRMWVYFNVDFRYSPSHVIAVVEEALQGAPIERVATTPPPNVICYDFAKDGRDSFGYYAVRYWLTDLAIDDPTSSAIREHVYAALRRANIPLARPTQTVLFAPDDSHDLEGRAARHRIVRAKVLEGVELFRPLTDAERTHLADHLVYAPFAKGETITHQGAVAHWLYILIGGRAEIRSKAEGDAKPRLIATLQGPAVFGEMGLFTGEPRTADVVAITDVECYRLDKAGFEQIIHDRPEVAATLAKTMAKRRIELGAAMDGVPAESRRSEELGESDRILERIRDFFGLAGGTGVIARDLPARTPEEIARLVRALGSHRYVAGRLLLVHAFVLDALDASGAGGVEELREAVPWAQQALANGDLDRASRDERLWRRATERELGAALAILWSSEEAGESARARLAAHLESIEALPERAPAAPLFDEATEDEMFPVLIDAGWELLPLAALDPERHRGAIEAFGERFDFECALFDEASAREDSSNPASALQELPAIGARELLHGAEHGILRAPLVLWTEGSETYHDYVMRGVLRAAKLD